jgi:tetratricopeptide (TPR) repeat protein
MALKTAQNAAQPDMLSVAYGCLAMHEALACKFDGSLDYGRQASQVSWGTGDLRSWGLYSQGNAQVLIYQGKFPQALEIGQRLLDLGREVGDPELRCWGLLILGTTEYCLELFQQAHDHLLESTQLAKQIPDYYSILFAGGQLGQCLLAQGEFEPALAILEESREFSVQHHMRGNALTPVYQGLMKTCLMLAEQDEPPQKGKWLAKAKAASRDVRRQTRAFRGGLPGALLIEGHFERLKGNPGKAQRLWQRSLAEAERMGMRHMAGLAHMELGRISGDTNL